MLPSTPCLALPTSIGPHIDPCCNLRDGARPKMCEVRLRDCRFDGIAMPGVRQTSDPVDEDESVARSNPAVCLRNGPGAPSRISPLRNLGLCGVRPHRSHSWHMGSTKDKSPGSHTPETSRASNFVTCLEYRNRTLLPCLGLHLFPRTANVSKLVDAMAPL